VFNTSEDTTDLLRIALEAAGFVVVTAFTNEIRDGKVDLESYMRQHRPRVIVYDIALPYDRNWRLFEHVRDSPACRGVRFVITTTNVRQVEQVAAPGEVLYEIIGKPYDLDVIAGAVRAACDER
jgi:CheY-like chemotaxis protein